MDTMNQGSPMGNTAPMGTPMNAPKKKSSTGMIILLIVVVVVIALLVLAQNKKTEPAADTNQDVYGQTEPVNNNSDELNDLEADVNSLNFDDIDAGLQ